MQLCRSGSRLCEEVRKGEFLKALDIGRQLLGNVQLQKVLFLQNPAASWTFSRVLKVSVGAVCTEEMGESTENRNALDR